MLRAAPGVAVHEKGSDVLGRGLKKLLFFCFAEVGGGCQKSKTLKFGGERNELSFFCCICCILGLDLNFQTTITNEFVPAIRRKLTHRALGATRNKMDFFLEHHSTQNMKRDHSTNGLDKKDVTSPQLFWPLYTFGPLRS